MLALFFMDLWPRSTAPTSLKTRLAELADFEELAPDEGDAWKAALQASAAAESRSIRGRVVRVHYATNQVLCSGRDVALHTSGGTGKRLAVRVLGL